MIEQKFLAAFNQLLTQRDFIADDMQTIIRRLTNTAELDAEKKPCRSRWVSYPNSSGRS